LTPLSLDWLNSGFCVNTYFTPFLDMMEKTVNGVTQENKTERKGQVYKTKMTVMNFMDHPLADIRQLGPVQMDKCGQILNVGDRTLGGIFMEGDANSVLVNGASDCNK
jgi:hypothetical protein